MVKCLPLALVILPKQTHARDGAVLLHRSIASLPRPAAIYRLLRPHLETEYSSTKSVARRIPRPLPSSSRRRCARVFCCPRDFYASWVVFLRSSERILRGDSSKAASLSARSRPPSDLCCWSESEAFCRHYDEVTALSDIA